MSKHKLYIHASTSKYDAGKISIHQCDVSKFMDDYALICTREIELDIPEFDIVSIQVDGIEKQIAKVLAEAQMTINQLEQRKQELLAIGVDTHD